MILQWRDSDFSPEEKVLGIIYDAGAILQTDLALLLGLSLKMCRLYVERCNRKQEEPLIQRRFKRTALHMNEKQRFYTLSEDGAKYVHRMIGNPRNAKGVDALANHQLGLIDILMRYTQHYGQEGLSWYATSEATDLLAAMILQENPNVAEDDVKTGLIRPDAALLHDGNLAWIEFDNSTEGARQLQIKYNQYNTLLQKLDLEERHVVWVAKAEKRVRVMQAAWEGWMDRLGEENVFASMSFFVEGDETEKIFPIPAEYVPDYGQ